MGTKVITVEIVEIIFFIFILQSIIKASLLVLFSLRPLLSSLDLESLSPLVFWHRALEHQLLILFL